MYLHRQAERRFSGNPLHLKTVNITKVMIPVFVILVVRHLGKLALSIHILKNEKVFPGKGGMSMKKMTPQLLYFILLVFFLGFMGCHGIRVENGLQEKNVLGPQSNQAKGEQHVLMVAVRFPDVDPTFSLMRIEKKVVEDFNRYVKEQSYGLTWVKANFRGWIMLPDPILKYKISPYNFKVDRSRIRKLIKDTMAAIEKEVDFSKYQHMLIIPGVFTRPGIGYGMICYCANPGMLSGVRINPRYVTLKSKNGKRFQGGIFVGAETAHLGMFAHDFFHAIGGVHNRKRLVP